MPDPQFPVSKFHFQRGGLGNANSIFRLPSAAISKKNKCRFVFYGWPIYFLLTCSYFCQPSRQTFWRGRDWQTSPYEKKSSGRIRAGTLLGHPFRQNADKTCSKLHFWGQNGSPQGRPRLAGFFFLACFFSGGQLARFPEGHVWGAFVFSWLARLVFS